MFSPLKILREAVKRYLPCTVQKVVTISINSELYIPEAIYEYTNLYCFLSQKESIGDQIYFLILAI